MKNGFLRFSIAFVLMIGLVGCLFGGFIDTQVLTASADTVSFSEEEAALIAQSKQTPVKVAVLDNSAPLSYYDEKNDEYEGISVELMKIISEKTGLEFEFVATSVSERYSTDDTYIEPDIACGIINIEGIDFNEPWIRSNNLITETIAVVGVTGKDYSSGVGKTLAIIHNFKEAISYAEQHMSDYTIVEYDSFEECMMAVAKGRADATIYMQSCINYYLEKPRFEKLSIIPIYSTAVSMQACAFSPENEAYIGIINKGLGMISETEYREVVLLYTVLNTYELTFGDFVYKYRAIILCTFAAVIAIVVAFVLVNLSERRNSNIAKEALAIANRANEAKTNFLSRMSHEIRTPLNAIVGYNHIAAADLSAAKTDADRRHAEMKVMDCLTKSETASRHLLTIINDILDMSAIESGKITIAKERFDFKGMITSLTSLFASSARSKQLNFEVVFDSLTEEWFVGDQLRTNQILTNLLSNAVKFTPTGGSVKLSIYQPDAKEDASHIHFEVADTGIGMTEDFINHIWIPFEQADSSTSRRYGGSGLGLAITKKLVELMGGSITVDSTVGKGTVFKLDLTFGRTDQPDHVAAYDFSSINALVVDDDQSTCDYIKLLFSRCGAKCVSVTSGAAAVEEFEKANEANKPFTLCMVDWRMPEMDGLETIQHLRDEVGGDLPTIIITAYDLAELAQEAESVGVNLFISKPLFQSSLFNLLANISGSDASQEIVRSKHYDFKGTRVLLADDNLTNLEIARQILESTGLTVDTVLNGQEAVDTFITSAQGYYSVILMDVQMPILNGHDATRAIRNSQHPDASTVPIIAMTADAFAENVAESKAAGMNDHITKPIDMPTLFRVLSTYIHNPDSGSLKE